MTINNMRSLGTVFAEHGDAMAAQWVSGFETEQPQLKPNADQRDEWRRQAGSILRLVGDLLAQGAPLADRSLSSPAIEEVGRLAAAWMHEGYLSFDAARFLLSAHRALRHFLPEHVEAGQLSEAVGEIERLFESLALAVFQSHGQSRERVIQEQSLSLIELSSPVVKLWDQILLLPLVGVIDTLRARAITERLLDNIAREEAEVTIVDVTGVPVFDTGVAGHLMKTVAAAEMLGTSVIFTGISAEGAQTLVKLGVDLGSLKTRGTLRAGVAEALSRTGHRLVPIRS